VPTQTLTSTLVIQYHFWKKRLAIKKRAFKKLLIKAAGKYLRAKKNKMPLILLKMPMYPQPDSFAPAIYNLPLELSG
jgi:hypothetical protein